MAIEDSIKTAHDPLAHAKEAERQQRLMAQQMAAVARPRYEVDLRKPDLTASQPNTITADAIVKASIASSLYNKLQRSIIRLQQTTQDGFDLQMFVLHPAMGKMPVVQLGYHDPAFMVFYVPQEDGGEPEEVIMHVSQMVTSFKKVKRASGAEAKPPIGFAGELTGPKQS